MVEDASEGVSRLPCAVRDCFLHRLADCDAQAPRRLGIVAQDRPARFGRVAGAGNAGSAPGLHHVFAIRLLLIARFDHVHLAFKAELGTGEGQRRAPLARAGFRREAFYARRLVVVGLGDGRVGLVAACGRQALVLEIDPRRRLERFFKAIRPLKGGRTPLEQNGENLFRYVDPALRGHFLLYEVHGKHGGKLFGGDRFPVGAAGRLQGPGQVRRQVVPLSRHLVFCQNRFCHHFPSLPVGCFLKQSGIFPDCFYR